MSVLMLRLNQLYVCADASTESRSSRKMLQVESASSSVGAIQRESDLVSVSRLHVR